MFHVPTLSLSVLAFGGGVIATLSFISAQRGSVGGGGPFCSKGSPSEVSDDDEVMVGFVPHTAGVGP